MHYLDNAATTKPKFFAFDEFWGNANSIYKFGTIANDALAQARQRVKNVLGVKTGVVIFGGTATQLLFYLLNKIDMEIPYIITSPYEHDAVYKWSDYVSDINNLKEILSREYDCAVCWMYVNNLTGEIFNAKEIGNMCLNEYGYYIMDCTASIGHIEMPEGLENYCDCVVASAHKFHGPKGTGFMWISDRLAYRVGLHINDSHDEYGLIAGTPDVPNIIAMTNALEYSTLGIPDKEKKWKELIYYLMKSLQDKGVDAHLFVPLHKTYAINAITLPGINADALVQYLSSKQVYVTLMHSACAEDADYRVANAYGYNSKDASETIRVSLCEDNYIEDINALVDGIVEFKEMFA